MFIEKLTGIYDVSLPTGIILNVNGVGYGLEMPLSSLCELPSIGNQVTLWVFTHVREDSLRLFGFTRYEDRKAFEVMLSLSGVGPKVALAILSTLSISAIRRAIHYNDPQVLVAVPGVGPRLAEKILVDLKPKLEKLSNRLDLGLEEQGRERSDSLHRIDHEKFEVLDDVYSALENLGFKEKAISPIIKKLKSSEIQSQDFQDVMRDALKMLAEMNSADRSKPKAPSIDRDLF